MSPVTALSTKSRVVVHLSPTYWGPDSLPGGAERYVTELAQAMARKVPTRLVSFGSRPRRERREGLEIHIYRPLGYARGLRFNPISVGFLRSLLEGTAVIHCHQLGTLVTDAAILCAAATRKPLFATDLGGSADCSVFHLLPLWKKIRRLLLISEFNRKRWARYPIPAQVIYGGIDAERFRPGAGLKRARVLHVGRILPHKGIHHLIDALPAGVALDVVGPVSDPSYFQRLRSLASRKEVAFHADVSDDALVAYYQNALATVLPIEADGGYTTALESMACGTPVLCAQTGGLPEIVKEGVSGFAVPSHDPAALRSRIVQLAKNPALAKALGEQARRIVLAHFTWDTVVDQCLGAYQL